MSLQQSHAEYDSVVLCTRAEIDLGPYSVYVQSTRTFPPRNSTLYRCTESMSTATQRWLAQNLCGLYAATVLRTPE